MAPKQLKCWTCISLFYSFKGDSKVICVELYINLCKFVYYVVLFKCLSLMKSSIVCVIKL